MTSAFRLNEVEHKTVQRAVKEKLAARAGGADEVLPEYVMVVRCALHCVAQKKPH